MRSHCSIVPDDIVPLYGEHSALFYYPTLNTYLLPVIVPTLHVTTTLWLNNLVGIVVTFPLDTIW